MGKWIPVSKGLPTECTRVLICSKDGIVSIAAWTNDYPDTHKWRTQEWYGDPIAWMPLPKGYTGEEEPEECKERILQEWLKDESEKNTAWMDAHKFGDCQIEYSMRLGREEVLGKVMSLLGIE